MTFYEIVSDDYEDGGCFFGTKDEALREAKAIAKGGGYVTVYRAVLADTTKASIVALANQRGWAAVREEIWSR